MRNLILTLAIIFLGGVIHAQENNGVTVTVVIENVLNDQGNILAALHTEETFMRGGGIADYSTEAKAGELSFQFDNVVPGVYAVSVMQDKNENYRMDIEANGMPVEPYGFSGNNMAMGPPVFDNSKFEVEDQDLEIRIRF
ncbi:MAG: DUF2141 domain-containing protein [Eudoraea sp.]|nr:DUF2141 domain-containing protein [Eudoraea sp.]